jgi:orotate phosphoribosyltransferase
MKRDIISILKDVGAVITDDHFVYTSGKHGSVYIRKDKLYPHPDLTSQVCQSMAENVKNWDIDVVVGPMVGGIILSQWTAYHLSLLKKKEVLSVFTEKPPDDKQLFDRAQIFKRGYDEVVKGKNVLVVEDLTTTGESVKKVVDRVREVGGHVAGVYVLVNRNPKEVHEQFFNAPFKCLTVYEAVAYEEKDCPLCQKVVPINTQVGHGKEYLSHLKK